MGGISVGGGGHGNRKSVDAEVSLMPTIDLLLCCIMFLLVTAVWSRLGRLDVDQRAAAGSAMDAPAVDRIVVYLQIRASGFTLGSTAGEQVEIPSGSGGYDLEGLHARLAERQLAAPDHDDLVVAPDDGVTYEHVIAAVDTAVTAGFTGVTLSDQPPR
ncbi:ExbD/TolR family protein [Sandaracinus amylolyticus]|uniref:ExbD/TolR family protein n=1 Tax=Sandaracinus amylolyticus TaxID=927083 RepID=UPI0012ED0FB1|nr:biopolymer transporter ExbD [Sandaracinus amylolyticus]